MLNLVLVSENINLMKKIYSGQTLIQLIIGLGLSVFLIMILLKFYSFQQKQYQDLFLKLELQQEIHRVLNTISKNLMRTGFIGLSKKESNIELFNLVDPILFSEKKGEIKNSCILFFYDFNIDGCIGDDHIICAKDRINRNNINELYGYRLENGVIKARSYSKGFKPQCNIYSCPQFFSIEQCNANGWEKLTDENKYHISDLSFNWLDIEKSLLSVYIKASLVGNINISYESHAIIYLINKDKLK